MSRSNEVIHTWHKDILPPQSSQLIGGENGDIFVSRNVVKIGEHVVDPVLAEQANRTRDAIMKELGISSRSYLLVSDRGIERIDD